LLFYLTRFLSYPSHLLVLLWREEKFGSLFFPPLPPPPAVRDGREARTFSLPVLSGLQWGWLLLSGQCRYLDRKYVRSPFLPPFARALLVSPAYGPEGHHAGMEPFLALHSFSFFCFFPPFTTVAPLGLARNYLHFGSAGESQLTNPPDSSRFQGQATLFPPPLSPSPPRFRARFPCRLALASPLYGSTRYPFRGPHKTITSPLSRLFSYASTPVRPNTLDPSFTTKHPLRFFFSRWASFFIPFVVLLFLFFPPRLLLSPAAGGSRPQYAHGQLLMGPPG